ncbi:class I SAM-dependent methyltransferase [Xenophilus sp.]|uniref:class I SAM-dependent methyltransferase n=1 Tax=Xenophilus sp. TaxID=1873499 RepID=UPI0037DCC628
MQFTSDWFSTNIPAWTGFFAGWDRQRPHVAVEIGSYEGRSSVWLLENVLQHPESRLHCIDVFAGMDEPDSYGQRFMSNVAPFGERVTVHRGFSFDHLIRLLVDGVRADFVYVDGSHRAADVLEDLILGFRLLNPGGLMICDDYLGGAGSNADLTLGSPKMGVDAFTTLYRDRLEIVGGQPLYQLAMRKSTDRTDDDPASRGR